MKTRTFHISSLWTLLSTLQACEGPLLGNVDPLHRERLQEIERILRARVNLLSTGESDVTVTARADRLLINNKQNAQDFLERHLRGDWGDVGHDLESNNYYAIETDGEIYSAYLLADQKHILCVVTDLSASPVQTFICTPNQIKELRHKVRHKQPRPLDTCIAEVRRLAKATDLRDESRECIKRVLEALLEG